LYLSAEKKRSRTRGAASAAPSVAAIEIATPASHGVPTSQCTPDSQPVDETNTFTSNTALDLELMADAFLDDTDVQLPRYVDTRDFMFNMAQLATTKAYLMHEMLAVSGLRRFSKDKARRELMTRALYHQSEALRLVQFQLESVSEGDCLALLFFTSHAALCGLAEPAFCDIHDDSFDPIGKSLHAFQLSRGVTTLIMPHWSVLRTTWAWPAIASQIEAGSDLTPQPQSIPGYTHLRCLALGLERETDRQACLKALEITLGAISMIQQREDVSMSRRLVSSWPMETGITFHELLSERRPVSLVIIAYYAVLLKIGAGLWWVGNLPEALIEQVSTSLGAEWADFISWPRSVIQGNSSTPATYAETAAQTKRPNNPRPPP
jgi:hypothetical protein